MAYEQAIMLTKEKLKAQPHDSDLLGRIAVLYAHIGKAKEADEFLARAKASNKKNPSLAYSQASIDALLGRKEEALKALKDGIGNKSIFCQDLPADLVFEDIRDTKEFTAIMAKCPAKNP